MSSKILVTILALLAVAILCGGCVHIEIGDIRYRSPNVQQIEAELPPAAAEPIGLQEIARRVIRAFVGIMLLFTVVVGCIIAAYSSWKFPTEPRTEAT